VLPGALVVLALSAIYATFGHVPWIVAAFAGIKATVLVLVIEAMLRIGRRALTERRAARGGGGITAGARRVLVPYPLVVLVAGLLGSAWSRPARAATEPASRAKSLARGAAHAARADRARAPVTLAATLRTARCGSRCGRCRCLALVAWLKPGHVISQLAWFFSKLAVVTFGGAYAALGYMAQDVVTRTTAGSPTARCSTASGSPRPRPGR
jgi:chromate transporter